MSVAERYRGAFTGAGLYIGGFAWTMSTVIGAAYADYSCALRLSISGMIAAVALALAILGALLSWRSIRMLHAVNIAPVMPARHARLFFARVSIMAAGLFALAIIFQLLASGVFSGCER